ncbi:MAG TPA: CocE/NonD family hydrolase [Stellaceae bacterium]|nr:CocE/NonD family hydrolase [Stellaceae bacterium]
MPHEMVLDKNVGVTMRDGAVLRANVFRPKEPGRYPVIMTFGPYGKDVHLSEFQPAAWQVVKNRYPQILQQSSCKYLVFETPDPELWVPHGYVVVKVDSRGAGKSPGKLDVNSPAEFRDFYDAIQWAGTAPWSSGKIGLLGISYYAAGQWAIAAQRPPHLAALLPWQGTYDFFRDRTRSDGIFSAGFLARWWARSVLGDQYGNPDSPFHDIDTGERNTGPASLAPAALAANREDYIANVLAHPVLDDWYRARIPDLETIELPTLAVANWGGLALHLRGTIAGWMGIKSREKWLKVQSGPYFITFLLPETILMQRRFFDRYLKDIDNGWEREPRVEVELRAADDTVKRTVIATDWPLPQTQWTRLHLDAAARTLAPDAPTEAASASYPALSAGVTFTTAPMERDVEIAGPVKLRLDVSSTTDDMDMFATLRAFDPQGKEVVFFSSTAPKAPVSQGWLRVSQRKLDPARTTAYRPYHTHGESEALTPGTIYAIEVEIWPTSLALPQGYRLALTLQGQDFDRPGEPRETGTGWFTHDDPRDRPPARFAGTNTVHTGPGREAYLLLPVIPA